MKILGIILAILMLSGSLLVGVLGANKARDVAKLAAQFEEAIGASKGGKAAAMLDDVPSSGRLSGGSIAGYLGAVAALGLLVVMFAKKNLVVPLIGAAVGLAVVSALIYPYVKTGPLDGMAPRPQALLAAGLAAVGGLGAWLAARKPKSAGSTATQGAAVAA
ncbi:MAG: hypothetical protein KF773_03640 [Deltaproteobacteria bacterium]|nr:hypothetical protein [Deltaproteobacteria bacterium]MCW5807025.1 hypothetical protein [Deltaproteobacteria bacterium]